MPMQAPITDSACRGEAEQAPAVAAEVRVPNESLRRDRADAWANQRSLATLSYPRPAHDLSSKPATNLLDRLRIPFVVERALALGRLIGEIVDRAYPALDVARAGPNMAALVKAGAKCMLSVLPNGANEKVVRSIKRNLRALKTAILPNGPRNDVIVTLPCVIRRPGRYRLAGDLIYQPSTNPAIEICANKVTLDLQGHTLRNVAGSATCATGIGGANVADAAIVNGAVIGFRHGILLCAGKRCRVENIRAEANWQWGLSVEGRDCELRDNVIVNTGGSTAECSRVCIALRAFGARQSIADNVISGVRRSPANVEWVGIHVDSAPNSRLENNLITAAVHEPLTWGIWLNGGRWGDAGGTQVQISRNVFINLHTGVTFADHSAGTCADNMFINAADSIIVSGPEGRMRNRGGNVHYLRVKAS